MYPVSSGVDDLYLDAFVGLNTALFFDFTPIDSTERLTLVLDFNGGRRRSGYLRIRGAAFVILEFTPPFEIVVDKGIGSVLWQGMWICGSAAVNIDFHIKGFAGIIGLR